MEYYIFERGPGQLLKKAAQQKLHLGPVFDGKNSYTSSHPETYYCTTGRWENCPAQNKYLYYLNVVV